MILLKEISKVFYEGEDRELWLFDKASMFIEKGEAVAIVGKSGTGKSTLLHILAGLDDYQNGEYYLNNKQMRGLREKEISRIRNEEIGIVMQDFALIEEFTALENVLLPLGFSKKRKRNVVEVGNQILRSVGMYEMSNKKVETMSGGQKQRIAIARALINRPQILLADEPTGSLDVENTQMIMEVFQNIHREGQTIVIATHDWNIAESCDRILEIRNKKIQEIFRKAGR